MTETALHPRIQAIIIGMINAIDSKNWKKAKGYFADSVWMDYSSLTGEPGAEASPADVIDGWTSALEKVVTHHMLTNFQITLEGSQAQSVCHVYGSHSAAGRDDYWDVFGRYRHTLVRQDDQWRITGMTLIVHGQRGNPTFLQDVNSQ